MNQQCVVGVLECLDAARATLERLEEAGFSQEQVSLVTKSVERQVEDEEMLEYGDKTGKQAAKGAGIGGLVGFLLGTPLLMIPGVGPLLIAGPLAMGMTGGIVGGVLGAMVGWGIEPGNLENYEQKVREGSVLIVVEGAPDEVARAHGILTESPADEVHMHMKSSVDSPEIDDRPE
jgi:hypothetical protein